MCFHLIAQHYLVKLPARGNYIPTFALCTLNSLLIAQTVELSASSEDTNCATCQNRAEQFPDTVLFSRHTSKELPGEQCTSDDLKISDKQLMNDCSPRTLNNGSTAVLVSSVFWKWAIVLIGSAFRKKSACGGFICSNERKQFLFYSVVGAGRRLITSESRP